MDENELKQKYIIKNDNVCTYLIQRGIRCGQECGKKMTKNKTSGKSFFQKIY